MLIPLLTTAIGIFSAPTMPHGDDTKSAQRSLAVEYKKEVQTLINECPATDGARFLQIARVANDRGLREECFDALTRARAANVDDQKLQDYLKSLATQELEGVKGAALSLKAQQLFSTIGNLNAKDPKDSIRALYTKTVLQQFPSAALQTELEHAIVSSKPAVREAAANLYQNITAGNGEALIRRIYNDPIPDVRRAASQSIASRNDTKIAGRLATALGELSPMIRIHAAEALGEIRKIEAVPALIKRWEKVIQAGSGGPVTYRGYFYSGNQQAYVSGYKVEVAQASAIAEPEISTLMDGVVLDVRVISTTTQQIMTAEKKTIQNALAKIAGSNLGDDPKAWSRWYKDQIAKETNANSPITPAEPSLK